MESPVPTLAIVGGQLIVGYDGRPLPNAVVLVADDRIIEIGQVGTSIVPKGVKTINSNGMLSCRGCGSPMVIYSILAKETRLYSEANFLLRQSQS